MKLWGQPGGPGEAAVACLRRWAGLVARSVSDRIAHISNRFLDSIRSSKADAAGEAPTADDLDALEGQVAEDAADERVVTDRHGRLGAVFGQGTQTGAEPRAQDEGVCRPA